MLHDLFTIGVNGKCQGWFNTSASYCKPQRSNLGPLNWQPSVLPLSYLSQMYAFGMSQTYSIRSTKRLEKGNTYVWPRGMTQTFIIRFNYVWPYVARFD